MSRQRGFTVVEMMIAVGILAIIVTVGVPSYQDFIEKGHQAAAAGTMLDVQTEIERHYVQHGSFPESLAEIGVEIEDEWGRNFIYLPIEGHPENYPRARVSPEFVVLNSDYDLYTRGKDGLTNRVIHAEVSLDDVIRANNGSYFGLARKF